MMALQEEREREETCLTKLIKHNSILKHSLMRFMQRKKEKRIQRKMMRREKGHHEHNDGRNLHAKLKINSKRNLRMKVEISD